MLHIGSWLSTFTPRRRSRRFSLSRSHLLADWLEKLIHSLQRTNGSLVCCIKTSVQESNLDREWKLNGWETQQLPWWCKLLFVCVLKLPDAAGGNLSLSLCFQNFTIISSQSPEQSLTDSLCLFQDIQQCILWRRKCGDIYNNQAFTVMTLTKSIEIFWHRLTERKIKFIPFTIWKFICKKSC